MILGKMHLLRENCEINDTGKGLGLCYTFGRVTKNVNEVECKNCLKRLEQEKTK